MAFTWPRLPPGVDLSLLWHVFKIGAATLVAAVLLLMDPFDLDRGVSERARSFFYKAAAFAYPEQDSPRTLVVLLDDNYLEARQLSWPLSYAAHAGIIDQIASGDPQAIFIDFTFIDERNDAASRDLLVRTLRRAAETTRIYIASGKRDADSPDAEPDIQALVDSEPNIDFVSIDTGSDLGDGAGYVVAQREHFPRPAAVALFEDLCADPGTCDIANNAPEMDIWWAVRREGDFNCRGHEAECARIRQGLPARVGSLLLSGLGDFVPPSWRALDPVRVPYAPTVPVSALLNGANADDLAPRLRGAVVIYGARLDYLNDVEVSPVHGLLPAAQAHAMAYDNLHVMKDRYIKAPPPFDWARKWHMVRLTALLALAALVLRAMLTLFVVAVRKDPDRKTKWFNLGDGVIFVIGAILIAYIEFDWQRIGPIMWAPVLVAVAAGNVLAEVPWASWVFRKVLSGPISRSRYFS